MDNAIITELLSQIAQLSLDKASYKAQAEALQAECNRLAQELNEINEEKGETK